jgi:starch synthase
MYIVMIAAELAPVAKAGGLGDFVAGLAHELRVQGHRVEVILPRYDTLPEERVWELHKVQELWVPLYGDWIHCEVLGGQVDGLDCFFIDPHAPDEPFRRGRLYGEADDPERFALFSRAALEFLYKEDRGPDVLHCHDWHTGLVPVLLEHVYRDLGLTRPRVCHTLHNLAYQGRSGEQVLRLVGLDAPSLMTPERLQDPGDPRLVNPLQGAVVYADYVTTVSPRYAWEARHSGQGMGLEDTLRRHADKFGGILNGIDYEVWNPAGDPHIAFTYGPDTLQRKARDKAALRLRLGLEEAHRPLVAVVSRLVPQKGPELMLHALQYSLAREAQFVLLGAAQEPELERAFQAVARRHASDPHCRLHLCHDEELAHQVFAAADILVVPSRFEPCGLTQMIAMRYGVVPVVHRVGGLADTVFDANYSERDFGERNGFVFDEYTPSALEGALERAIALWREHPEYFRQLRLNGMACDHSWAGAAQRYLDVYAHIAG